MVQNLDKILGKNRRFFRQPQRGCLSEKVEVSIFIGLAINYLDFTFEESEGFWEEDSLPIFFPKNWTKKGSFFPSHQPEHILRLAKNDHFWGPKNQHQGVNHSVVSTYFVFLELQVCFLKFNIFDQKNDQKMTIFSLKIILNFDPFFDTNFEHTKF